MTIGNPDQAFDQLFHMNDHGTDSAAEHTIAQILALINRQARQIVHERDRIGYEQPTNQHPYQGLHHCNLNAQLDALADTSRRICEHFGLDHLELADQINNAHTSATTRTRPLLDELERRRQLALDTAQRATQGKGAHTPSATLADAYTLQAQTIKDIIHWITTTEGKPNTNQ